MKIDSNKFEKNNWDEFVHVRALMDLLKKVAESDIGKDNIKSIDQIGITPDENDNPVYHATYTDQNGNQQKKDIPLSSLTATVKSPFFAPVEMGIKNMRFLAEVPSNGIEPELYDLTGELANGQTYHIPIYQTSIESDMTTVDPVKESVRSINIDDNKGFGATLNIGSAMGHEHSINLGGPIHIQSKNNAGNLEAINIDNDDKTVALRLVDGNVITFKFGNDVTIDDPGVSTN